MRTEDAQSRCALACALMMRRDLRCDMRRQLRRVMRRHDAQSTCARTRTDLTTSTHTTRSDPNVNANLHPAPARTHDGAAGVVLLAPLLKLLVDSASPDSGSSFLAGPHQLKLTPARREITNPLFRGSSIQPHSQSLATTIRNCAFCFPRQLSIQNAEKNFEFFMQTKKLRGEFERTKNAPL